MMRIELRSDTKTLPSPGMRRAMAEAEVGDEQSGEDPSVNRLCAQVADLLGHEAALFLPSGTMCNQIAVAVLCRPGDEIVAASNAHLYNLEGAGTAVIAGVQVRPVPTLDGLFSVASVEKAMMSVGYATARVRAISIEQTANLGGGTVWPLALVGEIAAFARSQGMRTSMDGARLLNAAVALGCAPADFAGLFDLAWVDLSKGLGCPVGGVLAGPADLIDEARYWKHRLGGAMRQAGILAAAGLYALEHNIQRLAEDHQNARALAAELAVLPGLTIDVDRVATNIILIETTGPAGEIATRLAAEGVLVGALGPGLIRAVTHLDFHAAMIPDVVRTFTRVLAV